MRYREPHISGQLCFDFRPQARTADPASSYQAGHRHTQSGDRQAMCEKILAVMEQMLAVGFMQRVTAWEICSQSGMDHTEVCRRLPDLVAAGLICRGDGDRMRICSVIGRRTLAYWIERKKNRFNHGLTQIDTD